MKTEKELTDSILQKGERNIAKRMRNRKILTSSLAAFLCLCLIGGAVGFAVPYLTDSTPDDNTIIRDPDDKSPSGELTDERELPSSLYDIAITAEQTVKGLVKCASGFTVKTTSDTTAETLYEYLSVNSGDNMTIEKTDACTFRLTLGMGILNSGEVYRFTVGDESNPDYSYAFQTESKLAVSSYLPADEAVHVPLNTGIEVTFSEGVTYEEFAAAFSITPAVSGSALIYPDGRTAAFVPKDPLDELTEYTVTIKAGLKSVVGHELEESYTFRFCTDSERKTVYFTPDALTRLQTGAQTEINVYVNSNSEYNPNLNSVIYKYPDYTAAKDAIIDYEQNKIAFYGGKKTFDVSKLDKVSECSPEILISDGYNCSLIYPRLSTGVYLIVINYAEGQYAYAHVIVSDYVLYSESSGGDGLLWITDADGNPAAGADIDGVRFCRSSGAFSEGGEYTDISGKTNADGVYTFKTGEDNAAIVTVTKDGKTAFAAVTLYSGKKAEYGVYTYTDRETYFSNDKVNVFGFIDGFGGALPERLIVKTGTGERKYVKVSKSGSFEFSFDIEDFVGGNIDYTLYTPDGVSVHTDYITVTQQSKPMYIGSLSFDKAYYSYGDKAEMTLTATFFDGTPAPGLMFRITSDYFDGEQTVTTGANGTAHISARVTYRNNVTSVYILLAGATLVGVENTYLNLTANDAAYFAYDKDISVIYKTENGVSKRLCSLRKLDCTKIQSRDDVARGVSYIKELCDNGASSGSVRISLIKHTRYTVDNGTAYNPITKKSYKRIYYRYRESTEKTYTASFDSNGFIELPFYEGCEEYYYHYEISSDMGTLQSSARAYNTTEYTDYAKHYTLSCDGNKYGVGDAVKAELLENEKPLGGRTLYTLYCDGLVKYYLSDSAEFKYEKDYISGAYLCATRISGGEVCTSGSSLIYDYEKYSKLTFELSTNADKFAPGDTVTVTVKVTLPDGSPAPGAVAVLSVADEACFALGEQNADTLAEYFAALSSLNYNYYYDYYDCYGSGTSYAFTVNVGRNSFFGFSFNSLWLLRDELEKLPCEDSATDGAGSKNQTSVNIRDYFADNPVFEILTSDKAGLMSYSFTVPDNITEWRLTVSGFCGGENALYAGCAVSDVICTLPYFITLGVRDSYVTGDDIGLTARSYGVAATLGDRVKYTAKLYKYDGTLLDTSSVSGTVGKYAAFNFGKLPVGDYYITVTGACGKNSDGLKQSFTVSATNAVLPVTKTVTPEELKALSPVRYPVTLVFTASGASALDGMGNLLYCTYGRADYLAAAYAANTYMYKLYGGDEYADAIDEIKTQLNNGSGLFSLLGYSSGDIILTAKVCVLAADALSASRKASLVTALNTYINTRAYSSDIELCAAYASLAALGRPVLCDLYLLQDMGDKLSEEALIYLAAAFTAIGDYNSARVITDAIKAEKLTDDGAETYYNAPDADERVRLTALLLLTLPQTDGEKAQSCLSYLNTHSSAYDEYRAEKACALKYYKTDAKAEPCTLTYSHNSGEKTVELSGRQSYRLTLGYDEFASLQLISCEGIAVSASYYGTYADALGESGQDGELEISKTIELYDKAASIYKVTVNYSVKTDKNRLCYSLTDTIPAGAMFLYSGDYGRVSNNNCNAGAYMYSLTTGNMTGYIYLSARYDYINGVYQAVQGERTAHGTVTYYIRVAAPGEYAVEPAIALNTEYGTYAMTKEDKITFKMPK